MDIPTTITAIVFFIAFAHSTLALLDFIHKNYITTFFLAYKKHFKATKKYIDTSTKYNNTKKEKKILELELHYQNVELLYNAIQKKNIKERIYTSYFAPRKYCLIFVGSIGLVYCILYAVINPIIGTITTKYLRTIMIYDIEVPLLLFTAFIQLIFFGILAYNSYNGIRLIGVIAGQKWAIDSLAKTYDNYLPRKKFLKYTS